ncbi:hypothetical protein H1D32_22145 [Anaerobacillus sp. CMMVII]|uniref:hypothetical protein n=1 Tax=Anaerobacillus sp. CMMVII TaxID=2755588 RepID=UPI0021B7A211|nr:hypothetical protein [Anaerobacillus sp. CMMVII]MCT8140159.1 hypothetical protein [Anaerobacillus sp. CMMVII]
MVTVNELYIVTRNLVEQLNTPFPKEVRESYIERVEVLLAKRQDLINHYEGKPTIDELEQAKQIIQWNNAIEKLLKNYLETIKVDLNKLKQQKETGKRYENPYVDQTDGYFIDKKN